MPGPADGDRELMIENGGLCKRSMSSRPLACNDAAVAFTAMSERSAFTIDQARDVGERIGINWTRSRFDVEQLRVGMDVELEHGTHDPETNVTDDDIAVTAKIARAHLNELP